MSAGTRAGERQQDAIRAGLAAGTRPVDAVVRCANCGSARPAVAGRVVTWQCPDCEWPVGVPLPAGDFCAICRRRHGAERTHACE